MARANLNSLTSYRPEKTDSKVFTSHSRLERDWFRGILFFFYFIHTLNELNPKKISVCSIKWVTNDGLLNENNRVFIFLPIHVFEVSPSHSYDFHLLRWLGDVKLPVPLIEFLINKWLSLLINNIVTIPVISKKKPFFIKSLPKTKMTNVYMIYRNVSSFISYVRMF